MIGQKLRLGDRVGIAAVNHKVRRWVNGRDSVVWLRREVIELPTGFICGRRTVWEGYVDGEREFTKRFRPTSHIAMWLVAVDLVRIYYVREEDLVKVEEATEWARDYSSN